jgi:hypothetical protein
MKNFDYDRNYNVKFEDSVFVDLTGAVSWMINWLIFKMSHLCVKFSAFNTQLTQIKT